MVENNNGELMQWKQIEAIFENFPEIIYVTDPDTHEIIFVNNKFKKLLGHDPKGKLCYRELQGFDEPCEFCTNEIIMNNGGKPHTWKNRNKLLDRIFQITDQLIKWPDGRILRFELAMDITEIEKAEESLRLKNQMLMSIHDYSEAITFAPPDQLYTTIVTKLKEITGAAEVLVNYYDEEKCELVLAHTTLSDERNTKIRKILGNKLEGFRSPLSKEVYKEIMSTTIGRRNSLHEASFGEIPKPVGKMIEKMFSFGKFTGLALTQNGKLEGTIMIAEKKGGAEPGDEELLAYASTTANVLARRSAEISLAQNEERFRSLIEKSSDVVMIISKEGKISYASPSFQKIFNTKIEDFMGGDVQDLLASQVHPDDMDDGIDALISLMEKPGGETRFEFRFKHVDGTWHNLVALGINHFETPGIDGIIINIRDVTKQKKAEESLKTSEAEFRTLAESMPQIVWATRPDGWNIYFNQQWVDYTGLTLEESYGHGWNKPFHPDDQQRAWDAWQNAVNNNAEYSIDCRLRRHDGTYQSWLIRGVPQIDENGKILKWFGTCTNIEQLKHAEKTLRENEALLNEVGEISKVGGWEMDLITRKARWTKATYDIVEIDYDQETPGPDEHVEFYLPEYRPMIEKAMEKLIVDGENLEFEAEARTAKGNIRWFKAIGQQSDIIDGKCVKIKGTLQDITEQKKAEYALIESEERFRELVNTINSGVAIYKVINDGKSGKDYIIQDFNRTSLELEGLKKEDVIGKSLFDIRPNIDEYGLISIFREVWITGKPAFYPAKIYVDENFSNYYENRVFRIPSGEIVAIYDDVTDREIATEKLNESKERFDLAMRASKDGIFDWNLITNEIYYSPGWKSMLGYEEDELPNDFSIWENLTEPEDVKKSWEMQQEVINKQRERFEMEFKMKHKDGHWVDILSRAEAVFDENGKATRMIGTHIDITERKKAEEALKESEEKFKNIFEFSNVAKSLTRPEGRIEVNQAFANMLGYSKEEINLKTWQELTPEEDIDPSNAAISQVLDGKKNSIRFEKRYIHKDGHYIWGDVSTTLRRDRNGNPEYFITAIVDISERKKAEFAIIESEEKFRQLAESIDQVFWLTDWKNKELLYVSPAYEKVFEESLDNAYKDRLSLKKKIHPDDYERVEKLFNESGKEGKYVKAEYRLVFQDGKVKWIFDQSYPIHNENGELVRFVSIAEDITSRKFAEIAMMENEDKFRTLFEESVDAVYITDRDGNIIDINKSGCEMLGYSRYELIGQNALLTYVQKEDRAKLVELLEKDSRVKNFELILQNKDGERLMCLISATTRKDESGKIIGYQGIIHDITDRMVLMQRYKEEFERAEFYNDLMGHDVRNYNQGIMSNLELLLYSNDLSEKHRQYSRNAMNQVIGSSKLISNLQMLSELKHGNLPWNDMDIIPFIGEALDYVKSSYSEKKIIIKFPDENNSIIVKGNALILEVFNNILTNAIKFNRKEIIEIEIIISMEEDFYKLEFRDNGPGIEDSVKTKIFERSARSDEDVWGTGLGLTLVKYIMTGIDGEVWVEDRVKGDRTKGSNFILKIPRGDASG